MNMMKNEGKPMKGKMMKRDCAPASDDDDVAPDDDKRKRVAGAKTSMKSCQAEKCSADLAAAKAYHRRHKVCEHHAKAQVAVVAGIRQRFCQQCSRWGGPPPIACDQGRRKIPLNFVFQESSITSWYNSSLSMTATAPLLLSDVKDTTFFAVSDYFFVSTTILNILTYPAILCKFHELSEFDDAKRSCRRRLAGHNERRRKNPGDGEGSTSGRIKGGGGGKEMVCGQVDDRGRIQMSVQENSTYKHFHVR